MIAIIGAMQQEVDEILVLLDTYQKETKGNVVFYTGKVFGKDVVIVLSGIGKVNAAISTTVLLENYPIKYVINIGTAGGLKTDENVLDVIVATKVAQFDIDVPGENWIRSFDNAHITYECDSNLIQLVQDILKNEQHTLFVGPIVTSDQFIYRNDQIDLIKKYYPEALCAEMEAGSIAQVCRHYQVPFIVVRSLSDITLKKDNDMDFETYVVHASARSAKLCMEFVKRMN